MENGPCKFVGREIEARHPGKGDAFPRVARERRGVTAWVEKTGRIGIGESLYPVLLSRVEDATLLDAVWRARAAKLGEEESERPEGWWTFELRSR